MSTPEIALALTTYQKPWHLRRALASIAAQQGVRDCIELVVTDDGSTDETAEIVRKFRQAVDFPVHFTTHEHGAFHPARCRNEGVAATTAPYLLFLDGDCVLPPDHVATHLAKREPGKAMLGDCLRLEQEISQGLSEEGVGRFDFLSWNKGRERRRLVQRDRKTRLYSWLRHPSKPKLVSNNVGIWRADYQQVNGFDENYRGWGCEDDDLGQRLIRCGVRLSSILRWTHSFHLWHPRDSSAPQSWREGPNVPYFLRRGRLTRCRNGLVKRPIADLAIRVVGQATQPAVVAQLLAGRQFAVSDKPEVEILFLPGDGQFSRTAECRLLVVLEDCPRARRLAAQADVLVAPAGFTAKGVPARRFRLDEFPRALESLG